MAILANTADSYTLLPIGSQQLANFVSHFLPFVNRSELLLWQLYTKFELRIAVETEAKQFQAEKDANAIIERIETFSRK